jgi:hypothetical protein
MPLLRQIWTSFRIVFVVEELKIFQLFKLRRSHGKSKSRGGDLSDYTRHPCYKCMNQLLFDRSIGNLGPQIFARIQTSVLFRAVSPAPNLLFNGGEKEASLDDDVGDGVGSQAEASAKTRIWAHQAGVNALALDIEGRMYAALRLYLVPC